MLEKLPGWVFVEWSAANDFVQDVNYPSNMLYAGALAAAGRMYNLPQLRDKADKIREVIRQQSFDGHFFVDNAVRTDGKLQVTKNHSEVCQYFAFHFDVATPETHPDLWKVLRDEFGPNRKQTKAYWDEVRVANSFIGNMLRFELLSTVRRPAADPGRVDGLPAVHGPSEPARCGKTTAPTPAAITASLRTSSTRSIATCWELLGLTSRRSRSTCD